MATTNIARSGASLLIGGAGVAPTYCGLGSGSGVPVVTSSGLFHEVFASPRTLYTSRDVATPQKTIFTFDFGSIKMSGTSLNEFALTTGSVVGAADAWTLNVLSAPVVFDGSNEAQIEISFETF